MLQFAKRATFHAFFGLTLACVLLRSALGQTVLLSADDAPTTEVSTPTSMEGEPIDLSSPVVNPPSIPSAVEALPPALTSGAPISTRRPLHLTASLTGGYDDNVNTTNIDPQGSGFVGGSLGMNYSFGTPRTRFSIQTGGGLTYYFDRPGQQSPDYNGSLGLSLSHRMTPRLSLDINAFLTYQTEPNFALNLGVNRRTGSYFFANSTVGLNYLWSPRFSTVTSYTFNTFLNEGQNAPPPTAGQPGLGTSDDHIENTFANEFRYLILPTTTVVLEYRLQFTSYQSNNSLDSVTQFGLVGINHTFSSRLSASVRGGAQFRSYETSGDTSSPYFEGTVVWVLGRRSTLSWTNQYGIEEPDTTTAQQRTTFHTGLNVGYNWTARISSNLSLYYNHDDLAATINGPSFTQDTIDASLSGQYAINRFMAVTAGYNHTSLFSDQPFTGYDRNRVFLGLNLRF